MRLVLRAFSFVWVYLCVSLVLRGLSPDETLDAVQMYRDASTEKQRYKRKVSGRHVQPARCGWYIVRDVSQSVSTAE